MLIGSGELTVTPGWVESVPAVDAKPKKFGLFRKAWPWIKAAFGLGKVWWFTLAPMPATFTVLIAAWLVTRPSFGVGSLAVIGLTAPLAVGLLGLLAGWNRVPAAARTSMEIGFWLRWPHICGLCGFVAPGAGRGRMATLESVEFGPGLWNPEWTRLTISPLLLHEKPTWGRYEDRLARHLKAGSSTWTTGDTPATMVIALRNRPLPDMWLHGQDVPTNRYGATVETATGMPGSELVYLGVSASGGDVIWCPDESGRSSVFAAGRMGGGKNGIADNIIAHALNAPLPWRLLLANPKRTADFRYAAGHAAIAKEPGGMFDMISAFRAELARRADVLDGVFGVRSYLEVPIADLAGHGMAERWLLLIDEFVSFASKKGVVFTEPPNEKDRPIDRYRQVMVELQDITSMGRSLGMSVVIMTQHPIAEHLGPFGSTMKSNAGARIGLGSLEPEGAAALFGKSNGEAVSHLLRAGTPGRMVYHGLRGADGAHWQLGQARYIPPAALPGIIPPDSDQRPPDFDGPYRPRPGDDTVIDLNERTNGRTKERSTV